MPDNRKDSGFLGFGFMIFLSATICAGLLLLKKGVITCPAELVFFIESSYFWTVICGLIIFVVMLLVNSLMYYRIVAIVRIESSYSKHISNEEENNRKKEHKEIVAVLERIENQLSYEKKKSDGITLLLSKINESVSCITSIDENMKKLREKADNINDYE